MRVPVRSSPANRGADMIVMYPTIFNTSQETEKTDT